VTNYYYYYYYCVFIIYCSYSFNTYAIYFLNFFLIYIFLLFWFPCQTLIFAVKQKLYLISNNFIKFLINFSLLMFKIIPYHNSNLGALIFRLKIICQGVLSRKNTTDYEIIFIYLFILKKDFNQLFFKKKFTKFN